MVNILRSTIHYSGKRVLPEEAFTNVFFYESWREFNYPVDPSWRKCHYLIAMNLELSWKTRTWIQMTRILGDLDWSNYFTFGGLLFLFRRTVRRPHMWPYNYNELFMIKLINAVKYAAYCTKYVKIRHPGFQLILSATHTQLQRSSLTLTSQLNPENFYCNYKMVGIVHNE